MTKRTITPHKGGRTIKKSTLVTPEVNQMLQVLKRELGMTLGDLIDWAAKERHKRIKDQ